MTIPIKNYVLAIALLMFACQSAFSDPAANNSWLPGYYSDSSLRFFFNHDNDLKEDRYVTEGVLSLEYIIFSKAKKLDLLLEIMLATGMGESVAENLPFAPLEMRYNLNPFLEYKQKKIIYRFGWNHGCKHLIYKDNTTPWYEYEASYIEPDVYFNRLFFGIGTPTIRRKILREYLFSGAKKMAWYFETGHYLQSLEGLFDPDSLNGGNDWSWNFELKLKYPLLVNNSLAIFLNNTAILLLNEDNEAFWQDLLELELMFRKGECGSSIFAGINLLDEHPRDSREGMGELGFRFFF